MGFWEIFWLMGYFFLLFIWVSLLFQIFGDIFRSDMSGWAKAGWSIFVIVLPLLGILIYLIAHGADMGRRSLEAASERDQAQREYIQSVAGSTSSADEIAKLAELKNAGALTEAEFDAAKAKLLA
jgi:hypothetical protein